MEHKKGIQLSQAFGAVLAVVLIAVLVIIGIVLFEALASTGTDQARTVANESGATATATAFSVAGTNACGAGNFVATEAWNVSDVTTPELLPAANFTLSSAGLLTNGTLIEYPSVNVSYTFTDGGATCNATEDIIDQFATYPALIGLVGTIVFLGLVIGVLVTSFVFGNARRV